MELRHVATRLIASHDTFRAAFADAATAAVHLALDPRNPDASAQRRSVQRFVTLSLAHMAEEESATFIQALTCGVSPATIDRFLDDHRDLRALARVLEVRLRSELDDDGAFKVLRYIQRFEEHVQREEWALAHAGLGSWHAS